MQRNGERIRMSTQTSDLRLAQEIFAAWQVELARTRWLGPRPVDQDHTVEHLVQQYLTTVTPRKSFHSQRHDRRVLTRFSLMWGTQLVSDLSPETIEAYMVRRLKDVSLGTVSKVLGTLRAAYRCARRWSWTSHDPFKGILLNQEGNERTRWLTEQEEQILLSACPSWLADLVAVGVDTGLRRSNLVLLQRGWLHNEVSVLIIPRLNTKSKKLSITIPLTTRAATIIRRYLAESPNEHVFVRTHGLPYSPDQVGAAFRRAARSVGLLDVTLHTLRHTFISRLVQEGRPLTEVALLVGHMDIRMTQRYAHLGPEHLHEGIRALERRHATYERHPDSDPPIPL